MVVRGVAFPSPGSGPVKYSAAAMVVTVGPPFRMSPAAATASAVVVTCWGSRSRTRLMRVLLHCPAPSRTRSWMEWVPVPRAERDREASSKRELMEERAVVVRGVAFPSPGSGPVKYSAPTMLPREGGQIARASPARSQAGNLTGQDTYEWVPLKRDQPHGALMAIPLLRSTSAPWPASCDSGLRSKEITTGLAVVHAPGSKEGPPLGPRLFLLSSRSL